MLPFERAISENLHVAPRAARAADHVEPCANRKRTLAAVPLREPLRDFRLTLQLLAGFGLLGFEQFGGLVVRDGNLDLAGLKRRYGKIEVV